MTSTTTLLRAVTRPAGRVLAALTALAGALIAAFVLAPPALAAGREGGFADERHLTGAFRAAFVQYWRTGDRGFTPDLQAIVDYWSRYHAAKAVIAAMLLAVLVALGAALWRALLSTAGAGAGRTAATASAGVAVTMLALFTLATVMANVQGAVEPFASLLPLLMDGPGGTGEPLAGTLEQVRQHLTDATSTPALEVTISAYTRYHAVMVVIAGVVAAGLAGMSVASWRWFARTAPHDRRRRRAAGSSGLLMALSAAAAIVVAVANTTTTMDPVPGLLAFFEGGW